MLKKWKKGALLAAVAIMVAAFVSCSNGDDGTDPEPEKTKVEELTLYPTTLTLALNTEKSLTATVNPADATVIWSSSDEEVATVDQNGKVAAVKAGTATITAKAGDKKATCEVTVKAQLIAVTSVSLNSPFSSLEIGATKTLSATIKPENADDKTVTWKSSDEAIATVDENGTVTAVALGNVTITAEAGGKKDTCMITVNPHIHDFNDDGICKTCGKKKLVMSGATINNQDILTAYKDWSDSVKEVVIVDGVKGIAESAFQGGAKALESVTIPDSVTSIGDRAFYQCKNLKNVKIGNGVVSIGKEAFNECSALESVTMGDRVEIIGDYAFYNKNNLTSVTLPASLKKIGNSAFYMTLNGTVTYKGSLEQWCAVDSDGFTAFVKSMVLAGENDLDLKTVTELKIPEGVTKIGDFAFFSCDKLESVTIPSSVTSLGRYAFSKCTVLDDVTIPDNVTSIGLRAFSDCTLLASATIGKGVTSIESKVFYNCDKLTTVTYNGTEKEWKAIKLDGDLFGNGPSKTVVCTNGEVTVK